jgi:hypothetical protein
MTSVASANFEVADFCSHPTLIFLWIHNEDRTLRAG